MNINLSVITVNWNGLKWLDRFLDSLKKQTFKNFEIIVVDNGSTDGSIEFIKIKYPKVRIIESKNNLGFSGGNNLGIKVAKGKYILLINNDVWIKKDFLEKFYNFYLRSNLDIVSVREAKYDGTIYPYYISKLDFLGHPVFLFNDRYKDKESFYLSGVCLIFSKKLYKESKGLDDNFFMYSEDTDWFWRLNLLKKTMGFADGIYIYHAGAGSTGSGIKYNVFLWRNENTLQMLLKNYKWYSLSWILPIYIIQNCLEILFFLVLGKTKISLSYIEGWIFNIKNFNRTMKERNWVQRNRKVGDLEIMKRMYMGFGKLNHLYAYISNL